MLCSNITHASKPVRDQQRSEDLPYTSAAYPSTRTFTELWLMQTKSWTGYRRKHYAEPAHPTFRVGSFASTSIFTPSNISLQWLNRLSDHDLVEAILEASRPAAMAVAAEVFTILYSDNDLYVNVHGIHPGLLRSRKSK